MSAPDFFFAVNDMFRHLHDEYGKEVLVDYWQNLGREHYRQRNQRWCKGGPQAIAEDWRTYFDHEPGAEVEVTASEDCVSLDIRACPAIGHLRKSGRDIVPYFCEHCDHVCGAQAEAAGYRFERTGGMGSCQQQFVKLNVPGDA